MEHPYHLYSEKRKLLNKLETLVRNFEAKSATYTEFHEDKKLDKEKKNFQLKHQILLKEIASIDAGIQQIKTQEKIDQSIKHNQAWDRIQATELASVDLTFLAFFKQFGQACVRRKRFILSINEIFEEVDLPQVMIIEILNHITRNEFEVVKSMYATDNFITGFANELSQISRN